MEMEKLLEDSVPCRVRAKRGCATHPRSIAERVRLITFLLHSFMLYRKPSKFFCLSLLNFPQPFLYLSVCLFWLRFEGLE